MTDYAFCFCSVDAAARCEFSFDLCRL